MHAPVEEWHDLFVMLGTSTAALLGLLFVATSLHLGDLLSNVGYGNRARINNYFLLLLLLEAGFVLTPQSFEALGLELAVANFLILVLAVRTSYRVLYRRPEVGKRGGFSVLRSAIFIAAFFAGTVGGVLLFRHSMTGLYVVTGAYFVVLVEVALNAWSIMLGIGEVDRNKRRRSTRSRALSK